MRDLLVPITGTTDASGNASITVQLPRSTEWHVGKFALETTSLASWKVTLGGSAVNYALGQRVAIGPELIQPMDVVVVTVSNGPAKAAIGGTLVGVSGTLEEILPYYLPAGSLTTLSLTNAAAIAGQLLHTTAPSATATNAGSFTVPVGTESLSVITVPSGAGGNGSFKLVGASSGFVYFQGVQQLAASFETVPVDSATDPSINWSWTSVAGQGADWFVSPLATAAPVDGAILPLPWQAPRTDVGIADSTGASPATVIAGVAGQRIWVWSWKLEVGPAAAARFAGLRASSRVAFDGCFASLWSPATGLGTANGNADGLRLPTGDGLVLDTTAINGETVRAAVGYTQA